MDKRQKVPDEAKKAAIQAALEGKDPYEPLRPYTSNPKSLWTYIKQQLRKSDPETAAKLPDLRYRKQEKPVSLADAMAGMQNAADAFFGACEDAGLRLNAETPETPKKNVPLQYDDYTVCCIESKTFGRFYWDRDHNHLDWTTAEGEEISFTPTGWKKFLEELPKVAEILGVNL
jgi:hypothetical protein